MKQQIDSISIPNHRDNETSQSIFNPRWHYQADCYPINKKLL